MSVAFTEGFRDRSASLKGGFREMWGLGSLDDDFRIYGLDLRRARALCVCLF